jgi:hypothetical protein
MHRVASICAAPLACLSYAFPGMAKDNANALPSCNPQIMRLLRPHVPT